MTTREELKLQYVKLRKEQIKHTEKWAIYWEFIDDLDSLDSEEVEIKKFTYKEGIYHECKCWYAPMVTVNYCPKCWVKLKRL